MDLAKKTDRIIIIILLVLAVLLPVRYIFRTTGIRHKQLETSGKEAELTYEDYNGKKIGILTGTNMEKESFYYFPDSEYFYYDGYPNMNTALENGVIDAYLADEPALRCIHASRPGIDYLKDRLTNNSYSFAFRKDDPAEKKLRDQFNAFLKEIKEDGTYEEIDAT